MDASDVLTCLLVDFGDLPRFQSWSNLSSFPFETMLSEIRRAKQPDRDPIAIGIRFFIFTNFLRFFWIFFFFWNFIFIFENLNSLYSRGRLKKSYPSSGMAVEKLVLLTTVWWVIYLVFTKYHAFFSSFRIICLTGRFILWTHSYILLLTTVNISYFP